MITALIFSGTLSFEGWGFPLQLIVAELLFLFTQKRREKFALRLCLSLFLFVCTLAIFPPFIYKAFPQVQFSDVAVYSYDTVYFLVLFIASVAVMKIPFSVNIWNVIFCCVAGYNVQHIAFLCYNIPLTVFSLQESEVASLIQSLVVCLLYIPMYILFASRLKKDDGIDIGNKDIILFSIVAVVVNIGLSLWQLIDERGTATIVIEHLYSIVGCLLILFLQFSVFSNYQLKRKVDVVEYMWAADKEHYELRKDNIEQINLKCHDLKHVVNGLKGEISESALKELKKAVIVYDSVLKTGNEALDVILTEKSLFCEKNKIQFTYMGNGEKLDFMDKVDIYSLFGNAVDNAVQAVMKLSDERKRFVSLTTRAENNLYSVHIENYFEETLRYEDGLPVTTKQDKKNHGFGLKSIELIARKYGGHIAVSTDGDIFILNIFLSIP